MTQSDSEGTEVTEHASKNREDSTGQGVAAEQILNR